MANDTEHLVLTPAAMADGLIAALERSGAARADRALEQASGLELVFRAFHLLALAKLDSVKNQFPATNQALMAVPDGAIEVERDALVHPADFLATIDVLDLLSENGLACIAPHLHRGWQDRKRSCLHARQVAAEAFGFAIGKSERDALLGGLAICNRIALVPPPVRLDPVAIRAAYGPVLGLIERLGAGAAYQDLSRRILGG